MASEDNDIPVRGTGRGNDNGKALWSRLALGVFLLPTVVVLFPTTMLLALLMLPTIVAYTIDKQVGRPFTITVALLNGAGCVPAILELWSDGHTILAAQGVLANPWFWLSAYFCAALGWTIYLTLPTILRRYYDRITDSRVRALQRQQDKLIEEWGEEVTGAARAGPTKVDANTHIDRAAKDLPSN
jgi:hypothetical protein